MIERTKSNKALFNKVNDHGVMEDVILDEDTICEIDEIQEAQITMKGSDSHFIVESMDSTSPLSTFTGIEGYEKDNSSRPATHRRKQRLLPKQTSIEDEISFEQFVDFQTKETFTMKQRKF